MDDFMREDQVAPESPSLYILGLTPPQPQELLIPKADLQQRPDQALTFKMSMHSTTGSEKDQKRRLAGIRSREKKKQYLEELERSVRQLTDELAQTEAEIKQCKDTMTETLRTQASAHEPTMRDLERLSGAQQPDLDQINLLLDVVKIRMGANAKERLSNMQYHFKQIINMMFPALHRYVMHQAVHQESLFAQNLTAQAIQMTKGQHQWLLDRRPHIVEMRKETVKDVTRLKELQSQLQKQAHIFEEAMLGIRAGLGPVETASVILFAHKNRYRAEFAAPEKEEEQMGGRKRVKRGGE